MDALGLHQCLERCFQSSIYRKILQIEAVLDAAKDVQQVPSTALSPPAAQTQQRLKAALRYLIQTVELVQHSIVLQLLGVPFVAAGVADVTSLHMTLKASMQDMHVPQSSSEITSYNNSHRLTSSVSRTDSTTSSSSSATDSTSSSSVSSSTSSQAVVSSSRASPSLAVKLSTVSWDELVLGVCLGEGGYGFVCAADWLGQPVAVKCLNCTDSNADHQLWKEAQMLAGSVHPHVVQCLAVCHSPAAIVMQWCEGGSLADALQRMRAATAPPPTPAATVELLRGVAAAVRLLHSHRGGVLPVLHCDLKPGNLLLTSSSPATWSVKLADFGLAQWVGPDSETARADKLTHRLWVAPELLQQEEEHEERGAAAFTISRAADVYSFGCIVWEVLTGLWPQAVSTQDHPRLNMAGHLPASLFRLHVPPRPPAWPHSSQLLPGLSDPLLRQHLEPLMCSCLRADPQQRPSIKEVHTQLIQLHNLLTGQPTHSSSVRNASGTRQTIKISSRRTHTMALRLISSDSIGQPLSQQSLLFGAVSTAASSRARMPASALRQPSSGVQDDSAGTLHVTQHSEASPFEWQLRNRARGARH